MNYHRLHGNKTAEHEFRTCKVFHSFAYFAVSPLETNQQTAPAVTRLIANKTKLRSLSPRYNKCCGKVHLRSFKQCYYVCEPISTI